MAARPGLEPGPPGSEPGVVPFHHLARVWSGRRDSNSQPPASEAGALPLRHVQVLASHVGTDGGIRTRTDGVLSAVPLPVGLRQRVSSRWTARDSNPQPSPCRGAALPVAPPARAVHWSRGRESNPRAGRMRPRCSQSPRRCDRSDSNRLPPGPRPGVSTTSDLGHSRRGGTRTPGFLYVRQAVCR